MLRALDQIPVARLGFVSLVVAALSVIAIGIAKAQESDGEFTVTVTVEELEVSISVSPDFFDFVDVALGATVTGAAATTITNDGDVDIDDLRLLYATGPGGEATCDTNGWDAVTATTPGQDEFRLDAGLVLLGLNRTVVPGTGTENLLAAPSTNPLEVATSDDVDLFLRTPASITTTGPCLIDLEFVAAATG